MRRGILDESDTKRFRFALTIVWTIVLLWQLMRVLEDAAAFSTLTIPLLGTGGSILLHARWATGKYLIGVLVLTLAYPFAMIAVFTLGAWLSGAPLPVLPTLWFPESYALGRVFFLGLSLFAGIHMLALYETARSEASIFRKM